MKTKFFSSLRMPATTSLKERWVAALHDVAYLLILLVLLNIFTISFAV